MTTTTLTGFIARTTDAAVGFLPTKETTKPFYIPRKKIASMVEGDELDATVTLDGETIQRKAIPCQIEVDTAFLVRLGMA